MIVEVRDNGSVVFSADRNGFRVTPAMGEIDVVIDALLDAYHRLLAMQRGAPSP